MAKPKPQVIPLDDFEGELIPPALLEIFKRLRKAGHDAFLVGGCLRDYLLGLTPKDFDTVTDAKPERIRALIPNSVVIGRRFRLVHARRREDVFEIATYRKPASKSQQRRADARGHTAQNVYGNQAEDAMRRDFTVNALYFDPSRKQIVDYVGGFTDLKTRVLRSIREPGESFTEDPVRMLRAARFAAKLDFTFDDEVAATIASHKALLAKVSRPRMRDELAKLFLTGHGEASLAMMRELELMDEVFPLPSDAHALVTEAMVESDLRFAGGHKLSTAYFFAVLLWHRFLEELERLQCESDSELSPGEQRQHACRQIMQRARRYVAITRGAEQFITSVFTLQWRLESKARVRQTLNNPRIRAAVHLFSLRAQVGEADPKLVAYWLARQPSRETSTRRKRKSSDNRRRSRSRRNRAERD